MINAPAFFGLLITLAYCLGAIPFAHIFSSIKGIDLSTVGSGNYGATNVYRVMGLKYALLVFFLDALKGAIPVMIAVEWFPSPIIQLIVAFTAIIGHMYSIFLGFRGGKGVATAVGVLFVLIPESMAITACVALAILFVFRYASLASIIGAIVLPITVYFFEESRVVIICIAILSVFIIVKHRSNLVRLVSGSENKL